MADSRIADLPTETSPALADVFAIDADLLSTPQTRSLTIEVLNRFLKEEYIKGTCLENATMTGTEDLDLDTFIAFYGTLTGNTTITVSNTPAAGFSFVRSLKIKSTSGETLTLPAGWNVIGTYETDGSENDIQIEFSNFSVAGLVVTAYINVL